MIEENSPIENTNEKTNSISVETSKKVFDDKGINYKK